MPNIRWLLAFITHCPRFLVHGLGDPHARERAREGLLVHVGVSQHAGGEDLSIGGPHLPAVGVVLPAVVGVAHRHREEARALGVAAGLGGHDVGFARRSGAGGQGQGGGQQRRARAPHDFLPLAERRPVASGGGTDLLYQEGLPGMGGSRRCSGRRIW